MSKDIVLDQSIMLCLCEEGLFPQDKAKKSGSKASYFSSVNRLAFFFSFWFVHDNQEEIGPTLKDQHLVHIICKIFFLNNIKIFSLLYIYFYISHKKYLQSLLQSGAVIEFLCFSFFLFLLPFLLPFCSFFFLLFFSF